MEKVENSKSLLPFPANAVVYPNFFGKNDADYLFGRLKDLDIWSQKKITVFGREVLEPRFSAWMGDSDALYTYSKTTFQPLPWIEEVYYVKERLEGFIGSSFNSVLLNLYRDGKDSMGKHRDNERELGARPLIASLSLGATRDFIFHEINAKRRHSVPLAHGDLLLMSGETQELWHHSLPRRLKESGPRINLTFRQISS